MEAFAVSKITATVPSGTRILAIIPMKFELYCHLFLFGTAAVNLSYPILYVCYVGWPALNKTISSGSSKVSHSLQLVYTT